MKKSKTENQYKDLEIISREETIFFTSEEEHYLDTHDNSVSGEITNFTLEDLEMFKNKDGDV